MPGKAAQRQQVLREKSAQPQPAYHAPAPLQQVPADFPPQHHTPTHKHTCSRLGPASLSAASPVAVAFKLLHRALPR